MRRIEAAQRRNERESKKRQKDLDRQLREQAKLSALERAKLEVDSHENALEVLLSIHKEQNAPVNWRMLASSLPPHTPPRLARHELAAFLNSTLPASDEPTAEAEAALQGARSKDDLEYQVAYAEYNNDLADWERLHSLAQRVLAGEPRAYTQAVSEFPALAEISALGSSIHITVHEPKLIECALKVMGREAIPSESKTLTTSGKVSVKAMPKARFHEIYQDYVCGCILRLAREIFALLPVDTALLTATVDGINPRTGHKAELPVLSMAAPRSVIERLDFERLDPSDALENFQHRGDVMASRKSGSFVPIEPLKPEDISQTNPSMTDLTTLIARARKFRTEVAALLKHSAGDPRVTD